MVVLALDFQVGLLRTYVAAGTHFLADQVFVAVVVEVLELGGVKVHRIVWALPFPLRDQHPVSGCGSIRKDTAQRGFVGKVFGVYAVHQLDGVHLLQRDGLHPGQILHK